jgi:hypothetical protein
MVMVWPWPGHEGCPVHRVFLRGQPCGRICRRCDVLEVHMLAEPGEAFSETLDIEPFPSGSA